MQVHLKQTEIELALKLFITQQGINLVNKSVGISFTAGRKDSGLSAEITIEELNGVTSETPTHTDAIAEVGVIPEEAEAIPVNITEVPPVKTSKLFG